MNDPFELLGLYDAFGAADISAAFAGAVARGVPLDAAREAMDVLRDPERRAAAAILSPSMSDAARRARAATMPDDDPAEEVALRALARIADWIDGDLAASATRPPRAAIVDRSLPPLPGHLDP